MTFKTVREKIPENVQLKDEDPNKILDKVRGMRRFPSSTQSVPVISVRNKKLLSKEWRDLLMSIKASLWKYRPQQQRQAVLVTCFHLWSLIG